MNFREKALTPIWTRVERGERLTLDDGLALYATQDIIGLGRMAHAVQRRWSGDAVYFVLNQKIEHTNVCVLSCKFCDFAVKKGAAGAYEMTSADILARLTPEIKEVHITGGMPADWPWERYLDIVQTIHRHLPEADVKAFTAVEIDFFHKKFRMPVEEILRQLKEAGVRTMPGGGAEVFSERVRKQLFHQKIGAKAWLDVHKAAHRLGIPTNSTLLYGHIETLEERLQHMMRLRETQDETGGFLTFIPLAFQPGSTGIKPSHRYTSAIDDLKTIAISRLMLDNFPHIKAYWVMLTEEVASVALNFGADDMDGTVGGEKIAHDAGAISPMGMKKDQLIRIIRDAGKIPVERDVYYNPIRIHADHVIGKIPYLNSIAYHAHLDVPDYKILPVRPRRMGMLSEQGMIDTGLFSVMNYVHQADRLDLIGYGLASRDQVKSVMLFSKEGWRDLDGKRIGIIDDTATSVQLLRVLLAKRYGVTAQFERLHGGVNDLTGLDAVLLIGDEALKANKNGLPGFDLVYDLAREWYDWQKLPFVFAVWAVKKSMTQEDRSRLTAALVASLERSAEDYAAVGDWLGRRIGLTDQETAQYLDGFNYSLGEREKEAIGKFAALVEEVEQSDVKR